MQKTKPIVLSAAAFLSKENEIKYRHFFRELDWTDNSTSGYYILSTDTVRLGESLTSDILQYEKEYNLNEQINPNANNLFDIIKNNKKDTTSHLVIPLFDTSIFSSFDKIASQLIFNRDEIQRSNLKIIFIISDKLLEALQKEAFDFIFGSQSLYSFIDLLHEVENDLKTIDREKFPAVKKLRKAILDFKNTKITNPETLVVSCIEITSLANEVDEYNTLSLYAKRGLEHVKKTKNLYLESRVYYALFIANYKLGNKKEAKKNIKLTKIIADQIKNIRMTAFSDTALGLLYLDENRITDAIKSLNNSLHKFIILKDEYSITINYINLGKVYRMKSDYVNSIKMINAARELSYNINRNIIEIDTNTLSIDLAYGKLFEAKKRAKNIIKFHRRSGEGFADLSLIYFLTGNLDASKKYAEKTYSISKDDYSISIIDSMIEFEKENREIAIQKIEKIEKKTKKENLYSILFLKSIIQFEEGEFNNTLKTLQKIKTIKTIRLVDNLYVNIHKEYTKYKISKKQESIDKIETLLEKVFTINEFRCYYHALILLAEIQLNEELIEQAQVNYQKAYDFHNKNGILKNKGLSLQGLGEVEMAKNNAREALKFLYEAHEIYEIVGYKLLLKKIIPIIDKAELNTQ